MLEPNPISPTDNHLFAAVKTHTMDFTNLSHSTNLVFHICLLPVDKGRLTAIVVLHLAIHSVLSVVM